MKNFKFNNRISLALLSIFIFLGYSFQTRACSPLSVPNLISQSVSGNNLLLSWQSTNAWTCTYSVQVEIQCVGAAFTGTNPATLFYGPQLVKPTAQPANYPMQSIDISALCPGTVYQFRARETDQGFFFSPWTAVFTFTTPGTFVPPTINVSASSSTICAPQSATLSPVMNNTCGLSPPTFAWAPSNGLSCTNCANPVANPASTTNYTCTITGGDLACWTVQAVKTIYVNTGNAILNTNVTQSSCANNVATATLSPAGSASVQSSVVWNPSPASVSSNSLVASGLPVGINTITVMDGQGCLSSTTVNILPLPPPVTFTYNNLSSSYSVTCANPTVNMSATTTYTYGTLNYTWTSASYTATGSNAGMPQQGTYNVCGMDPATSCSLCLTFTIGADFVIPTNTVNPTTQVITCNTVSAATFTSTVLTPTINFQTNWFSPLAPYPAGPAVASDNNQSSIFTALSPGVYTIQCMNLVNGCSNTKTVSVTSISGFPTFQTSSTTNYSVGCTPLNQTTLCMINAVSANNAAVQYLFLPPGTTSAVPVPTTAFGPQSCTVTAQPGNWTLIVNDPSNGCQTALTVPILQNTIAPHVNAAFAPLSQTLTCFNPTILATGTSTTPGSVISWSVPSSVAVMPTPTIILGPPTGPNTHSTNLNYANYYVIATNTVNACRTTSLVVVNQNFRVPTPSLAVTTTSFINCNNICPILSYTNNAANSGFPGAVGQVKDWYPQPASGPSTAPQYTACSAGVYTLEVRDSYNGCLGTKTWTIEDRTTPPLLVNTTTVTLDCGAQSVGLVTTVNGGNAGHSMLYYGYPHEVNFTPLNVNLPPAGVPVTTTVMVDAIGTYSYVVTNTVTGCKTHAIFEVLGGGLNADFDPQPATGFAPLNVNFINTSGSSNGTGSVTSVWSFGNGSTQTTSNTANANSTYNAAGTYTIMMIAKKGACYDTVYKTVRIELPSKLEIPNIFTPNDDGSNDVFFLKTQYMGEIYALIYDRWGNKVYEVTSNTGNIAWDGKSIDGKQCSQGTYFYIITALGKDAKEYSQKGHITLVR